MTPQKPAFAVSFPSQQICEVGERSGPDQVGEALARANPSRFIYEHRCDVARDKRIARHGPACDHFDMKNAEHVTFGGSGLDRAAHLRSDCRALAVDPTARGIVLWRGKVLLEAEGAGLLRVPLDHPAMTDAGDLRLFLGIDSAIR